MENTSPYQYQPATGVLSGDSFEAQTEAFFADIDNRLTQLAAQVQQNETSFTASINALTQQMQGVLQTLQELGTRLDAAENKIQQLQQKDSALDQDISGINSQISTINSTLNTVQNDIEGIENTISAIEPNLPPAGLVALFASTTPPQGWKLCNGQGGAPDLTGYTSAPLTYVQKGA